jgi:2,4-dienoyl-CoA reductase [(3E)-enoyl-CoA-producing], peroxisomal
MSLNAFKAVIDIDLIGSWITIKVTLPHMIRSAKKAKDITGSGKSRYVCVFCHRCLGRPAPSGRIIFVSSTNYHCERVTQAHVCAAKAGVNALSNVLSMEYGPQGLTSNIIAPGPIDDTEGLRRLSTPELRDETTRSIPVQRLGLVKDVADATVFLLGDTGNFINGACIDVDGGAWRIHGGGGFGGGKYPASVLPPGNASNMTTSKL